jgi:hypothetical protein
MPQLWDVFRYWQDIACDLKKFTLFTVESAGSLLRTYELPENEKISEIFYRVLT